MDKDKEKAIQGFCSETEGQGAAYYSFQKSDRVWWKIFEWRDDIGLGRMEKRLWWRLKIGVRR